MKSSYSIIPYMYLNLEEESLFRRYVVGYHGARPAIIMLRGKPNSS